MKKVIEKWEAILAKDAKDEITYSRTVLLEMLNDFKQTGTNTIVSGLVCLDKVIIKPPLMIYEHKSKPEPQ